jgi:hypothetical protein
MISDEEIIEDLIYYKNKQSSTKARIEEQCVPSTPYPDTRDRIGGTQNSDLPWLEWIAEKARRRNKLECDVHYEMESWWDSEQAAYRALINRGWKVPDINKKIEPFLKKL